MKIFQSFFLITALLIMSSCQNTDKKDESTIPVEETTDTEKKDVKTDIPYKIAENYFLKNTVEEVDQTKIETSDQFEEYFGMATTMGEKGTPTPIDFSREYVIPIALQKTRHKTQINPVSLVQDNDDLV